MRFGVRYPEVKSLVFMGAPDGGKNDRKWSVLVTSSRIEPQGLQVRVGKSKGGVSVPILDLLVSGCKKLNIKSFSSPLLCYTTGLP